MPKEDCSVSKLRTNLTGQRFGRLLLLGRAQKNNGRSEPYYNAICDCGTEFIVSGTSAKSGNSKSCGCWSRELKSARRLKHGDSRKGSMYYPLFYKWTTMKSRCYNKNNKKYPRYGGRGITICDEWLHSYEKFKEWSINNGYQKQLSIDRINNDGNYEPSNCRYATEYIQKYNKSTNRIIVYNGESLPLKQMAEKYNVSSSLLESRLNRGWAVGDAINKPALKLRRKYQVT